MKKITNDYKKLIQKQVNELVSIVKNLDLSSVKSFYKDLLGKVDYFLLCDGCFHIEYKNITMSVDISKGTANISNYVDVFDEEQNFIGQDFFEVSK